MGYVSVSSTCVYALERRCEQKKIRVKRPTSCYRVNKLVLGFLVLGLAQCWVNFRRDRVVVAKRTSFFRFQLPSAGERRWEDKGCVLFCALAMFVLRFYGCGGCSFLQGFEHGISLRMCEAYPAAALLICGGEPLCWWIRSRLGGLERGGWLRYWGSVQMICWVPILFMFMLWNNPCIVEREIRSWVNSVSVQSWEWLKEQLTNSSFCVTAWGNLRGVLSLWKL